MRHRQWNFLFSFIAVASIAATGGAMRSAAVDGDSTSPARSVPTFEHDIRPLLEAKCWRCHGGQTRKADLDLRTLAGMLQGGESGPALVAGKPQKSLLYEKVHAGAMPPGKKNRLSEGDVQLIGRWIEGGAQAGSNPSGSISRATPSQHEVLPILLRRCSVCHGLHRQEGGLDLRSKSAMLRGGKSGPAIVLGKPDESRILQRIRAGQMPPRDRLVEVSIKPIEPNETEVLARWIAAGAPEATIPPDVATTAPDPLVSDQDRQFWAFQPPRPVSVPGVQNASRVINPIDAFVLQKLEAKGLSLSPEADRNTLVRRASFDLTGLPPTPAEIEAFVSDRAPDAYEKMIDRLLASPRYGERWGRIWLDLAGYADSEGKREQDLPRPHAWRYRDYVIRSFNADKPFDRFLLEQLAGDELADYQHALRITAAMADNLVATGFLRMAPDATWANITNYLTDRVEVIADELDVLGSAVLGLTMKCARCHNHKFDPIPQRDYYRLVAVFKGAYDEYDWLKPDVRPGLGPISQDTVGGRLLPYVSTQEKEAWAANQVQIQREIDALNAGLLRQEQTLAAKHVETHLSQLPEVLRADLRAMLATAPAQRNAIQRYLAEKFEKQLRIDRESLKASNPEFHKALAHTEAQIRQLESRRQSEPLIQALWDRGDPSPTYIYRRGDPLSPGRLVGPGVPSVLTDGKTPFETLRPWPGAKTTGRRLALAKWLIRPDHPLTARVAVNRLWKHHFGIGIVKTLENFGRAGALPTHRELLDWLAGEFVRQGWSQKALHRLMMTSATYRQSSAMTPERERGDPDNVWYSRMPLVRLDAESLYDSLLLVAGRLDESRFGPGDPVQVRPDGLVTPAGTARGWRRLIYVQQARKRMATHLENFDFPQMNPNCVDRRDSTVATQALHLMNNGMVLQLAEAFASRVIREAGTDPAKQIERVYLLALGRAPSDEEKTLGLEGLRKFNQQCDPEPLAKVNLSASPAQLQALTAYCHAILNSAEFLFVD